MESHIGTPSLTFERLEPRRLRTIVIDVGTHLLFPNRGDQVIELVASSEPGDPDVSGMILRGTLGDGSGPLAEPTFSGIEFDGLWEAKSRNVSGGPLGGVGLPQFLQASVQLEGIDLALPTGIAATLRINTFGITSGTFELKFADTEIAGDSNFFGADGSAIPISIINGSVTIAAPWQNAQDPVDVNDDQVITAIDALFIVNSINDGNSGNLASPEPGQLPPFLDVSGDNVLSALDALIVVNRINDDLLNQPEGESVSPNSATIDPNSFHDIAFAVVAAEIEEKKLLRLR